MYQNTWFQPHPCFCRQFHFSKKPPFSSLLMAILTISTFIKSSSPAWPLLFQEIAYRPPVNSSPLGLPTYASTCLCTLPLRYPKQPHSSHPPPVCPSALSQFLLILYLLGLSLQHLSMFKLFQSEKAITKIFPLILHSSPPYPLLYSFH